MLDLLRGVLQGGVGRAGDSGLSGSEIGNLSVRNLPAQSNVPRGYLVDVTSETVPSGYFVIGRLII